MARKASNAHQLTAYSVIRGITKGLDTELAKKMKSFAYNINKPLPSSALSEMHREVGEGARRAVETAYIAADFEHGKPYRWADSGKNQRHSGAMRAAIKTNGLVIYAGPKGIGFVDTQKLKEFAPHWRRLNFGAGDAGGRTEKFAPGTMRFDNLGLGRKSSPIKFGFTNTRPSAGFSIPRGWWSSERVGSTADAFGTFANRSKKDVKAGVKGRDAFYLAPKKTRALKTEGIEGERFIDRGVRYLNQEYPRALVKVVERTMTEAARKTGFK